MMNRVQSSKSFHFHHHHPREDDHDERLVNTTTASSIMQRYLREQDRPFFTMAHDDIVDAATTHVFLGDLYDAAGGGGYTPSDMQDSYHHIPRRLPSPTSSGLESSSGVSSSLDDRQETPWSSSPEVESMHHHHHIWRPAGFDVAVFGDHRYTDQEESLYGHSCVAMNDVQYHHTDALALFEDDHVTGYSPYGSSAQEGYQPMLRLSTEQMIETDHNIPSAEQSEYEQVYKETSPRSADTPVVRRRRPQPSRAATSPNHRTSKVTKRVQPRRRSLNQTNNGRAENTSDPQSTRASNGAFPCPLQPYGCTSTFGSKNEWKRHVTSQHMRLGFWRCEWCAERKPNDFNRKDLFIQHIRRMHSQELTPGDGESRRPGKDTKEEQASNAVSDRCYRVVRTPPNDSLCLLCGLQFQGPSSWDERMEHMGRHLEAAKKGGEVSISPQSWHPDSGTHEWLIKESIIVPSGRRWVLADKM